MDKQRTQSIFWSLVISLTILITLCLFFHPRWETNDDVGMSMAAHGYGLAATGTPNIVFSNVIWGFIVRSIPQVNGVLGYSTASMGGLAIFGAVTLYTLRRLGFGWLTSIATVSLVLIRPILFPQFTINAGLLTVAAICCWYLYSQQDDKGAFLVGCLLAFAGYLVRSQQFFLVLLIALPIFSWRNLVRERFSTIGILCLLIAIGGAKIADYQAYQSESWQAFNTLNLARAPYTDFGADAVLLSRPDVYGKYGYSENDARLITSWGLYAVPELADPQKLNLMLSDIGFIRDQKTSIYNILVSLKAVLLPELLPIFLVAIIFLFAGFHIRLGLVFGLFFLSLVAMGLLGRPGVVRVYYSLVVFLLVFSVILTKDLIAPKNRHRRLLFLALFFGSMISLYNVTSQSMALTREDIFIRSQLANFPDVPVVVWAGFPYEAVFPVLSSPASSFRYKLHGLGVFSPAPFSVASRANRLGQDMASQFTSSNGLPIVANGDQLEILSRYCNERLHGRMEVLAIEKHGPASVHTLHCDVGHATNIKLAN